MTPEPLLTTTQIDTETGRKCRLNKIWPITGKLG
jgi:hypothetical protein